MEPMVNAAHWGSPFSEIVQEAGAPPEFIVGDRDLFRWPHVALRQPLEEWHQLRQPQGGHNRGIWEQPGTRWQELQPVSGDGARRVTVTRRPIDPHLAQRFDAVVVSPASFQRYRWPDQVRVILNETPNAELHLPVDPAILVCEVMGRPLPDGLKLLEQIAREHNLRRFAVESFGFEDEGQYLAAWRQAAGVITELSFHVAWDGLYLDFTPHANACE